MFSIRGSAGVRGLVEREDDGIMAVSFMTHPPQASLTLLSPILLSLASPRSSSALLPALVVLAAQPALRQLDQ